MTEAIPIQAYPGAPTWLVRDSTNPAVPRIVCALCGRPWRDGFVSPDHRPLCGPCFVRYPYNVQPDRVPPGCEMGGTGI